MQHILNTARGRMASSQDDLVKIATEKSAMAVETITEMPICFAGFSESDPDSPGDITRMSPESILSALHTILRIRPSAHVLDVKPVPGVRFTEVPIFVESPEAFRFSFLEKAEVIQDEFMRNRGVLGFRMEIHGVPERMGMTYTKPTVSLYMYVSSDTPSDPFAPLTITIKYRTDY